MCVVKIKKITFGILSVLLVILIIYIIYRLPLSGELPDEMIKVADELKEKKYHRSNKVTVTAECPAYPVIQLMKAFQNGDVEKAKEFCTEGYLEFTKNRTNGFKEVGIERYKTKMDSTKPYKFKFYNKENVGMIVRLNFNKKGGGSATYPYKVKKINDKWLIVAPE